MSVPNPGQVFLTGKAALENGRRYVCGFALVRSLNIVHDRDHMISGTCKEAVHVTC